MTIAACVAIAAYHLAWTLGLLFGWGWLWHILADGLTKEGVPFYWPFSDDRRHALPEWGLSFGRVLLTLAAIAGLLVLIYLRIQPLFS